MNDTETLFAMAFSVLKSKFGKLGEPPTCGKIYKIINNKDDNVYIGSTILELNERLEWHKMTKHTSKLMEYITNVDAQLDIVLVCDIIVNSYLEFLLYEDYHIYKNDTINNGLNHKYNTQISKIILDNEMDDLRIKNDLIMDCIDINYNTKAMDLKIANEIDIHGIKHKVGDPRVDPQSFVQFDDVFDMASLVQHIDKSIHVNNSDVKCNYDIESLDDDIYGMYIALWANNTKHIFCRKGGLKNLFSTRASIYLNGIVRMIQTNGFDFKIYPVYYLKIVNEHMIGENIIRNKIKELEEKITSMYKAHFRNNINVLLLSCFDSIDDVSKYISKTATNKYTTLMSINEAFLNISDTKHDLLMSGYNKVIVSHNKPKMEQKIMEKMAERAEKQIKRTADRLQLAKDLYNIMKGRGQLIQKTKLHNDDNGDIHIEEDTHDNICDDENIHNDKDIQQHNNDNEQQKLIDGDNLKIKYAGIEFNTKIGRPVKYTKEEARKSKLESQRKWRENNKNHVEKYNKLYYAKGIVLDMMDKMDGVDE